MADAVMGGRLVVHLEPYDRTHGADEAVGDGRRIITRIDRWAARLSRHSETSDLSVLNEDPGARVGVRPTLAAALLAGLVAADASEGFADITLLDSRLAAEGIERPRAGAAPSWLADRALRLLGEWPNAMVDADGDLAFSCGPGKYWEIGVDDPRETNSQLAVLRFKVHAGEPPARWGVATSGTSIHRWTVDGVTSHHLIDPRTGRPASTDIVQATVVDSSALRAEALAKAAVIAGRDASLTLLDRAHVRGAVLLTTSGEVLALPATLPLLAA
jgi:thiamine biosynthesis lipoprotein